MSVEEITRFMQEIEAEISERMEVRYKKAKWIDYTEKVKQSNARDSKKHLFLILLINQLLYLINRNILRFIAKG